MINIKRVLVIALSIIIIQACSARKKTVQTTAPQISISSLNQESLQRDSILSYALPMNKLRFVIKSTKTIKKAGPLYRYSERFIGIEDVILNDETSYQITSIKLQTLSQPDPTKYYQVNLSDDAKFALSLDKHGCIKSINGFGEEDVEEIEFEQTKTLKNTLDTSFRYTPYTEDQIVVNSTAKMAEEAANYIYRIRENRTALISGELDYYPADGSAMQIGIKEMDRLEKEFLALFLGKTATQEVIFTVDFLPTQETAKSIAFRFSQFKGVTDINDFSGNPIYISLKIENNLPVFSNDMLIQHHGPFYRIPATVNVKLSDGNKELLNEHTTIAQFGPTLSLPVQILQNGSSIFFNPNTGALKSIQKQ